MRTCLPFIHLPSLRINPCVAEKHGLVVGGKDRSTERPLEDYSDGNYRTTCNRNSYKLAVEGDGKEEENVSVQQLQAALQGTTNDDIMYTNSLANIPNDDTDNKDNSPRVDIPLISTEPINVATIEQHKDQVFAVAVAGDLLYSASASTDIRVFRAPLFEELDCFGCGNGMVNSLMAFGDRLYSAHQDNKIRVWKRVRNDTDTQCKHKLLAVLPRLDHFVKGMLLKRNYVQVRRHKKKLWIEHSDTISALALGGSSCSGAEGDDNGRRTPSVLYSASWDKTVKVWSLSNYKCIESFFAHNDAINAMTVIDGLVLATASADCSIKLWTRLGHSSRKRKHSLLRTLHGHKSAVNALAVSANEKILYSGGSDGAVIVWKRVYNKPQARLNNASINTTSWSGTISSSLSGDIAFLAGSGDIDSINLNCLEKNDSSSGEMMSRENSLSKYQNGSLAGLRRASHHKYRAVTSSVSFVMRKVMVGHTRAVLSVSTVGDGIVCSSSADKTIRVWRRREAGREQQQRSGTSGGGGGRSVWEYECLVVLAGHGGPVKSIASVVQLCSYTAAHQLHLMYPNNELHSESECTARYAVDARHEDARLQQDDDDDDDDDDDVEYLHAKHHPHGVVVYSAGLDSKVKVWALPHHHLHS